MKRLIALTVTALIATPAAAEGWSHTSAPMGQKEGKIVLSSEADGEYGITYSCTAAQSEVSFFVKSMQIAEGKSEIRVDGAEVASGNTEYNSAWDETSFSSEVMAEYGAPQKAVHNDLIEALAGGQSVIWVTPNGASYEITLTGSADIRRCKMD
jgi:hypothetical protein